VCVGASVVFVKNNISTMTSRSSNQTNPNFSRSNVCVCVCLCVCVRWLVCMCLFGTPECHKANTGLRSIGIDGKRAT